MKAVAVEMETDCPTCESGVYLVRASVEPPDRSVGFMSPGVYWEALAERYGEHEGECPANLLVASLPGLDDLHEEAIGRAGGR